MIITIGRKCGCNGDIIGHKLAEKYNMEYYNKARISEIAKQKGLYDKYPDYYSEIPMDMLLHTISMTDDDSIYMKTPKKALKDIVPEDNFVILGRCGNYAYKDNENAVSIFLTGDISDREKVISDKHNISVKKAYNLIMQTDDRRERYHKYYTGEEWGMAQDYDICLNVSALGIDGVVNVIENYINTRK